MNPQMSESQASCSTCASFEKGGYLFSHGVLLLWIKPEYISTTQDQTNNRWNRHTLVL